MRTHTSSLLAALATVLAACASESVEPTASVEQAAAQTVVYHSTWKGTNASVGTWSELEGAYVDVWQQGGAASLNFSRWQVDPTSQVCVTETYIDKDGNPVEYTYCYYARTTWMNGWGSIPASAFVVKPSGARLDTAIAQSDTFFVESCSSDYTDPQNPQYSCTTGVTGSITVAWGRDGFASLVQNGTQIVKYGKYGYKTVGNFRAQSALATGHIMGTTLDGVSGMFAQSHGVSISKDIVLNP